MLKYIRSRLGRQFSTGMEHTSDGQKSEFWDAFHGVPSPEPGCAQDLFGNLVPSGVFVQAVTRENGRYSHCGSPAKQLSLQALLCGIDTFTTRITTFGSGLCFFSGDLSCIVFNTSEEFARKQYSRRTLLPTSWASEAPIYKFLVHKEFPYARQKA